MIAGLAAPAPQDVVQKTALVPVVAEARGPVADLGPPAGVLAPTQDYRRGLAAFVSTIKGGNPDAQIAILDYAGATVTAIDFTGEVPTLDRYIQGLFPTGRPTSC